MRQERSSPRTSLSRQDEDERPAAARFTGRGICPDCGSLPHRVRGRRCGRCGLRKGQERGAEEQARTWAKKSHQWDSFY